MKNVEASGYSLHSPEVVFSEKSIKTAINALVNFVTEEPKA